MLCSKLVSKLKELEGMTTWKFLATVMNECVCVCVTVTCENLSGTDMP